MSCKEILISLKETIERNLDEIEKGEKNSFTEGEITAYIDCLELIQDLNVDDDIKIDYDISEKYPL